MPRFLFESVKPPVELSYRDLYGFRLGLGLWCLTPLSTIFQLLMEETTDLSQATDKFIT